MDFLFSLSRRDFTTLGCEIQVKLNFDSLHFSTFREERYAPAFEIQISLRSTAQERKSSSASYCMIKILARRVFLKR